MGAVHLLMEMVVVRFDGGAHQHKTEDTTMLNTTDKIVKPQNWIAESGRGTGQCVEGLPGPCQVMGMSRDTFYRYKAAVEEGGVEALFERTRRKPILPTAVGEPPSRR